MKRKPPDPSRMALLCFTRMTLPCFITSPKLGETLPCKPLPKHSMYGPFQPPQGRQIRHTACMECLGYGKTTRTLETPLDSTTLPGHPQRGRGGGQGWRRHHTTSGSELNIFGMFSEKDHGFSPPMRWVFLYRCFNQFLGVEDALELEDPGSFR